jgi:hypothetical protein
MNQNPKTIQSQAAGLKQARDVASLFDISGPLEVADFEEKGNINQQTYLISAGTPAHRAEYLLQKINPDVFKRPRLVMQAMISCIEAQRKALSQGALRGDEEWETIQLVGTRQGEDFLEIAEREGVNCWRMMVRMRNTCAYKSLWGVRDPELRLRVAEETAKGLALFGNLTCGMQSAGLSSSLPGYRDTRLYYDQLDSLTNGNCTLDQAADFLPLDPLVRQCTEQHFFVHLKGKEFERRMADPEVRRLIGVAGEQKAFALSLMEGMTCGKLRISVIHGDTKLDNFLFNRTTGKVRSLIDLDTIMPHTWLSDWGDMVRSLVNAGGEKEPDIQKIDVDLDVFKAMARGFLSSARNNNMDETGLMVEAAQILALELGIRFLTDYIRGDTYFRLEHSDPWDLNKTRAKVQFAVFEKLRAKAETAKRQINEILESLMK